jgi:hypothetical protein
VTLQMQVTAGRCQLAAYGWRAGDQQFLCYVAASHGCEACCRRHLPGVWVVGAPPEGVQVVCGLTMGNTMLPWLSGLPWWQNMGFVVGLCTEVATSTMLLSRTVAAQNMVAAHAGYNTHPRV